jgi:DNA-binding MarR family transcriptional regulator
MSRHEEQTIETLIAFSVFNEIGIIEQLSSNRFQRLLPDGVSLAGFTVLNHFVRLGKRDEAPVNLARAFQVTKGAMTNTLARLEALGLVQIIADPNDGRAKRVSLTTKGSQVRDQAIVALAPDLEDILVQTGTETLKDMLPGLKKLRTLLDTSR